jgi:tRNA nucleotidyltransferase/poly(A) polymerase
MADYIYLLDNRLSPAQRTALRTVRDLARARGFTVFLAGGAVRDLTSGSPVRDLDIAVQGNALALKPELEQAGAVVTGELAAAQTLFVSFPGSVRVEVSSTVSVTFPKPGKPVYKQDTILEDLRRRDFTANAMALSLNEGSYGLLMDPLNGVADIENRELRLVSNYGFIEDPIRMVRGARLIARLGWAFDEKTRSRYETGKEEGYISALSEQQRGYELEEIVHEEDPLRVLLRLESEGWLQALAPFWTTAKVDSAALEHLREVQTQLQLQGVHPDASAANFPLLTAGLAPKDVVNLKSSFVRPGFVREIESLEARAKELATLLNGKSAALPSQAWQILTTSAPEVVLWVAYSTKAPGLKEKFKNFFAVWPQVRQKIPYAIMQEMRIVPELPGYEELIEKLFFELLDEKLQTLEEIKAFLEPFSPPAPPPPVSTRRPRASKKDAKGAKGRKKALAIDVDPDADSDLDADDLDDDDEADDLDIDLPDDEALSPVVDLGEDLAEPEDAGLDEDAASDADSDSDESEAEPAPVPAQPSPVKAAPAKKGSTKKSAPKVTVVEPPPDRTQLPAKSAVAEPVKAERRTPRVKSASKDSGSAKKRS